MSTPFQLLDVPETADDAAIHKAYLRQVRAYPPERSPQRFQQIREAYETLRSHRARLNYRLFGAPLPELGELLDLQAHSPGRRPGPELIQQALARSLNAGPGNGA